MPFFLQGFAFQRDSKGRFSTDNSAKGPEANAWFGGEVRPKVRRGYLVDGEESTENENRFTK